MSSNNDIMVGNRPLSSLRVVDLKQELEKRGLSKSGSKKDLVERLRLHLQIEKHRDTGASADEEELPNYSAHDELADQNPFIREYLASQAELFHSQKVVKKLVEEEAKRESETSADEGVDSPVKQPPVQEKESPKTETRRQSRRRVDSQKEEVPAEKLMTRSSRSRSPAAATESENKSNNVQALNEKPKKAEVIAPAQKIVEENKQEPPQVELSAVDGKENNLKTETSLKEEVAKKDDLHKGPVKESEEKKKELEPTKEVEREPEPVKLSEHSPVPPISKPVENDKPTKSRLRSSEPKIEEKNADLGKQEEPEEKTMDLKDDKRVEEANDKLVEKANDKLVEEANDKLVEKANDKLVEKATDKQVKEVTDKQVEEAVDPADKQVKEATITNDQPVEVATKANDKPVEEATDKQKDSKEPEPEVITQENDENSNLELKKNSIPPAEEPMEVDDEPTKEVVAQEGRRSRSSSPDVKEGSPKREAKSPKKSVEKPEEEKPDKEDSASSSEDEGSSSRSERRSRSSRSRSRSRSPSKSRSRSRSQSRSRSRSVESGESKKKEDSEAAKQSIKRDNNEESRDEHLSSDEPTRKRRRSSSRSVSKSPTREASPVIVSSEKDKIEEEKGKAAEKEDSETKPKPKISSEEETKEKTLDRYKSSEKDSYSTKYDLAGEEALDYGEEEEDEDRGENDKPEFVWTRRVIHLKTKAPFPAPEVTWKLEEDNKLIVVKSELLNTFYREVKLVPLEQLKLEDRSQDRDRDRHDRKNDIERKPSLSKDKESDLEEPLPTRTVENVPPTIKRTVSIVPLSKIPTEQPEENDKSLTPPRNPPSNVLLITNLVRPFTLPQLKELLQRTGNLQDIWVDKIKSKCIVMFNTEEEAFETRAALHGVCWPSSNPKSLHVDYSTQENLDEHKRKEGAEQSSVTEKPVSAQPVPVREWDVGKKEPKSPVRSRKRSRSRSPSRERSKRSRRSSSPSRRRRSRSPTHERRSRGGEAKEPEPIGKALDELFRKTIATPSIYWLPLTPQQIAEKEELRRKRMIERERRLAELSKMRPR